MEISSNRFLREYAQSEGIALPTDGSGGTLDFSGENSLLNLLISKGIGENRLAALLVKFAEFKEVQSVPAMSNSLAFGLQLSQQKLVSAADIWSAFTDQERTWASGTEKSLDWFLMRQGKITAEQVLHALKETGKKVVVCRFCGRREMLAVESGESRLNCPECLGLMTEATSATDLHVEDEAAKHVPSLLGTVIAGCSIERLLGKGSMGAVYLAKHISLNKPVAVKILTTGPENKKATKRFVREARTAARLDHPNVVQVFDTGMSGDQHYIVMKFVEGESAAAKVKRDGPMPIQEAVRIVIDASKGLQAAHRIGFIHRDVKPDNIMIDLDGIVKVADFGLAKELDVKGSVLTADGQAMGTPHYMSPEQARDASSVGPAADIYSLGATLYTLLSGKPPFSGSTVWAVVNAALNDPAPDIRKSRPDVPDQLAEFLLRTMEKNPTKRPASMIDFCKELEAIVQGTAKRVHETPMQENTSDVVIRVEMDKRIHFAFQQNDVPVVKSIVIENITETNLGPLTLQVQSEPAFSKEWDLNLSGIAQGASSIVRTPNIQLSPSFLESLTERLQGFLRFEASIGGRTIGSTEEVVTLLAKDEWPGLGSLPEILAAFVLPNHPIIEQILHEASQCLEKWTRSSSLSGYQESGPKRVAYQAAAVYETLRSCHLAYVNPPASFETEGQRIRLPDRILRSKLATCLDVAILAAACLEQAGLHPLILFQKGHAFTGFWLQDECFPEPAVEDSHRVNKRVALNELLVFDAVGITSKPSLDFQAAVRAGNSLLQNSAEFVCAVDVRRARISGIRPMPERIDGEKGSVTESESQTVAFKAPDLEKIPELSSEVATAPEMPKTRLDRWSRKLLDLTLRNRLLNFRESQGALRLMCPDISSLENALAAGEEFRILSRPLEYGDKDPRSAEAIRERTGKDPIEEFLHTEMKENHLYSNLGKDELQKRLLKIFRDARSGLEDGGVSGLYVAMGFLSWYESPGHDTAHLAPILLLPAELRRKSIREEFSLAFGDEESRINVTLLEMLDKQFGIKISGLDPLPTDESGLDVKKILQEVRKAVKNIDRWDVCEDLLYVGRFSFSKFLMWRDLVEREADLRRNQVVNHLIYNPEEPFQQAGKMPDACRIDEERSPLGTYCPLSSDSSQLAAVYAAAEGKSFVLHGPPGTGKSQTITNLIAHCLAAGKSILFISEKMAALNVVHSRLKALGLDRFSLEIHSNKAKKSEVLQKLGEAFTKSGKEPQEAWRIEAEQIQDLRGRLNEYASALHKSRRTRETYFEAISRLAALRTLPRVNLSLPSVDNVDGQTLKRLRETTERLATVADICGGVSDHPWAATTPGNWSQAFEDDTRTARARLQSAIELLEPAAANVVKTAGLVHSGMSLADSWNLKDFQTLADFAEAFSKGYSPPAELLTGKDSEEISRKTSYWVEHGRNRDIYEGDLFKRYHRTVMDLDLDTLRSLLAKSQRSWWPLCWIQRRAIRKRLSEHTIDGTKPASTELEHDLDLTLALRTEEKTLSDADSEGKALYGAYWRGGQPDWEEISILATWAAKVREISLAAAGMNLDTAASLRAMWGRLACEGKELLKEGGTLHAVLKGWLRVWREFLDAKAAVKEKLGVISKLAWGGVKNPGAITYMQKTLRTWSENERRFRDWCAWRDVRNEAVALSLEPIVDACEKGILQSSELPAAFEKAFAIWWTEAIGKTEPVLGNFFSPEYERVLKKFRKTDDRFRELTKDLVVARLEAKAPEVASTDVKSSEMGILARELQKKSRHMSIRSLFQKIPNLLPRLKPCLLMSPISVAQYLDSKFPPFDIVVFDEASQIPVWDAVGAIARGRQAIIVGDPKQLPPTSFFQRGDSPEGEVEEDSVEDLESILDDCLAARMPSLHLDWHYRSRHESLIAFSNSRYYDGRLLTFPSPNPSGMGVSWRPVPGGIYDKAKTRTNRAEAESLVKEVLKRLKNSILCRRSIGIVTFSLVQQELIEDLLEAERRMDPSIDRFFSDEVLERVFVKNLENVQGDERDAILFSVGYGPDGDGKVSMNFGPLNRDGGERRLNVAITRARMEVIVFSTLRADQIDLNRTRARGVADLKAFLEYAETGASVSSQAVSAKAEAMGAIESEVAQALRRKGWKVDERIGRSGYRVDLGVTSTDRPDEYLLGIEFDGPGYGKARTARDRDKLRKDVLEELGWILHRVWAADWIRDPIKEVEKIEKALTAASNIRASQIKEGVEAKTLTAVQSHLVERIKAKESDEENASIAVVASPSAQTDLPIYKPFPTFRPIGMPESFFYSSEDARIGNALKKVVDFEGPMSVALAARRIALLWGIECVSKKVLTRVVELIPSTGVKLVPAPEGDFLWPLHDDRRLYERFRVPGTDESSCRSIEDLPLIEIVNAVIYTLKRTVSLPVEDLCRKTGKLFGFSRTSSKVREKILEGIDLVVNRGLAVRNGDIITEKARKSF